MSPEAVYGIQSDVTLDSDNPLPQEVSVPVVKRQEPVPSTSKQDPIPSTSREETLSTAVYMDHDYIDN